MGAQHEDAAGRDYRIQLGTEQHRKRRKRWQELYEVAKFFQGREIDGKKVYGAAIFTERGSEGITLGLSSALYAWGVNYDDPKKPYQLDGFTNSPAAVEALEFYKKLFRIHRRLHARGLGRVQVGPSGDDVNWFAFFPGLYSRCPVLQVNRSAGGRVLAPNPGIRGERCGVWGRTAPSNRFPPPTQNVGEPKKNSSHFTRSRPAPRQFVAESSICVFYSNPYRRPFTPEDSELSTKLTL